LRLDPNFLMAYLISASNLGNIAWYATNESVEIYRRRVTELRRRAEKIDPDWFGLNQMRATEARLGSSILGLEAAMRQRLINDQPLGSKDPGALYDYARLLLSAHLFETALAYFNRHSELIYPDEFLNDVALAEVWLEGPEKAIETEKRILPDAGAGIMTNLAVNLALVGRFDEARQYLAMLRSADAAGGWTTYATVAVAIFEGSITYGSDEFNAALQDESAGDFSRGAWCFMLGEVEEGIRYWSRLSGRSYQGAVYFAHSIETLMPLGVREDPRYQNLLDALGIGRQWTAYMLDRARELEPITGIPAIPPRGATGLHEET